MTITEIVLKVQKSNPDRETFAFKTLTKPALTKKSRATKKPTDFVVTVESTFKAKLGADYTEEMNAALAKEGRPADFVAQKPAGKHYVNGTNWLMESDTTPGKFYVALSRFSDRTTKYLIDGKEATPEQVTDLKVNYLPKAPEKPCLVPWRTYGLDSLVAVEACA